MNSDLLYEKNKVKLSKDDIFDRIINLKLTIATEQSSKYVKYDDYYIRSDYEIVYPDVAMSRVFRMGNIETSRYFIRKCQMKPSIKINYKKVSKDASVEIDVYVSNFYMIDSSGKQLINFSAEDFSLEKVEIMMGYWGQFKNMPHANAKLLASQFESAKIYPLYGVKSIVIDKVEYVTIDKLSPDATLKIHGWVGFNPVAKPIQDISTDTFIAITASGDIENVSSSLGTQSALGKIFFDNVTRRFLKAGVKEKTDIAVPVNGRLTSVQAKKYGVNVYLSSGAAKLSVDKIQQKARDSEGNAVDKKVYFNSGDSPENAVINIRESLGLSGMIEYTTTTSGDFLIFTTDEASNVAGLKKKFLTTAGDYSASSPVVRTYDGELPAIYNMSFTNGLVVIQAPFFYFVEPFEEIKFEQRYARTSLVTYFAGTLAKKNTYTVTSQTVSFATVDDINEMTLTCIGA